MQELRRRRAARTREAIVDAFGRIFFERRQRRIRVADVAAEAGIGRSTFYDHFSGAEQVHLAALARPFGILADAAAGRGDAARLERLLAHFWENRQRARDSFGGRSGEQAQRLLAELVERRLEGGLAVPAALAAQQLAAAALAPVRAWLAGRASATPAALAESLCRSGAALAASLRPES
jgi:AcrR family transcriptional regulator